MHQTAIVKNNPKKSPGSVGDGETVQFDVVEGVKVGMRVADMRAEGEQNFVRLSVMLFGLLCHVIMS